MFLVLVTEGSQSITGGGGRERGTQQENSYMKSPVTNVVPVTNFGRVNEASRCNGLTHCCDELCSTDNRFFRTK